MTTTIPTSITLDTNCPTWCTSHDWYDARSPEPLAVHYGPGRFIFPPVENSTNGRLFEVYPWRYVAADGSVESHVHLNMDDYLANGTEVGQIVAALLRAAEQAFGDGVVGELAGGLFRADRPDGQ